MKQDDVLINIGGQDCHIMSYMRLRHLEQGDPAKGIEPLSIHQYLSMLFNNLGYKKCPKDMNWMTNKEPIENVPRDQVIDYPITQRPLMINQEGMNLLSLLELIKYWCRGPIEKGYVLDMPKSFQLPPEMAIEFSLQNGIAIKRSASTIAKIQYWPISDILTRRSHNIVPMINSHYHNNCIRKFEEYAKQITVENPCAVFAACIVDSNILMSAIRNAEIKAAEEANSIYKGYTALRKDYDTVLKFIPIFKKKIDHIANIYRRNGAKGFVQIINKTLHNINPTSALTQKMELSDVEPEDTFDKMTLEERKKIVNSIKLTGEEIGFIYNYVSKKSFPEFLTKNIPGVSTTAPKYNKLYYPTLRRIYHILQKIKKTFPDLLNPKEKFIVSHPFYISPESFALYLKSENTFFVALPTMEFIIATPKQAIEQYKEIHNKDVLLDSDEMGDQLESPEGEDVDLEIPVMPDPQTEIFVEPKAIKTAVPTETIDPVEKEELEYSLASVANNVR